jgi:hypothetical protein
MDIKKINKQELSISEVYSRSTAEPEPRLVAGDALNQGEPPSWVERLLGEYASSEVLLLGHPTPLTIGRGRECDIHICHDSVSKVHASVLFDENSLEYYLVDEDSRNGTYINGNPLPKFGRPFGPVRTSALVMLSSRSSGLRRCTNSFASGAHHSDPDVPVPLETRSRPNPQPLLRVADSFGSGPAPYPTNHPVMSENLIVPFSERFRR